MDNRLIKLGKLAIPYMMGAGLISIFFEPFSTLVFIGLVVPLVLVLMGAGNDQNHVSEYDQGRKAALSGNPWPESASEAFMDGFSDARKLNSSEQE